MEILLRWLARVAGVGGALMAVFAVVSRLRGEYTIGVFQTGTLLQMATCALALAAVCYAAILVECGRRSGWD